MKKSLIKLGVSATNYNGIYKLGLQVKAEMTANIGLYPSPNPTLVVLTTHLSALNICMAKWFGKGNRGSQADLAALKVAATDVRNDLLQLAAYVVNTIDPTLPNDVKTVNLLASGFTAKHVNAKVNRYTNVFNVRIIKKKNVDNNSVYLKWKKPQDLLKGSPVRSYAVYKNDVFLMNITRTNLTVQRPAGTAIDKYTFCAINDQGAGKPFSFNVEGLGA